MTLENLSTFKKITMYHILCKFPTSQQHLCLRIWWQPHSNWRWSLYPLCYRLKVSACSWQRLNVLFYHNQWQLNSQIQLPTEKKQKQIWITTVNYCKMCTYKIKTFWIAQCFNFDMSIMESSLAKSTETKKWAAKHRKNQKKIKICGI